MSFDMRNKKDRDNWKKSLGKKKLYKFNWQGEGFNQVWAVNKREARKLMNAMGKSNGSRVELIPVQESLKLVKDVEAYWRWMPLMD